MLQNKYLPYIVLFGLLVTVIVAVSVSSSRKKDVEVITPIEKQEQALIPAVRPDPTDQPWYVAMGQGTSNTYENEDANFALLINSQAELDAAWTKLVGEADEAKPNIDFEQHTAVLFMTAQKPTGGYSVEINGASFSEELKQIAVHVLVSEPGKSCVNAEVISRPFHIIKIDKTTGMEAIVGNVTTEVVDC